MSCLLTGGFDANKRPCFLAELDDVEFAREQDSRTAERHRRTSQPGQFGCVAQPPRTLTRRSVQVHPEQSNKQYRYTVGATSRESPGNPPPLETVQHTHTGLPAMSNYFSAAPTWDVAQHTKENLQSVFSAFISRQALATHPQL